jgi:hypothetical protein
VAGLAALDAQPRRARPHDDGPGASSGGGEPLTQRAGLRRAVEQTGAALSDEQTRDLVRVAETCASVLHRQARSAEVFSQLLGRALSAKDYARVDALADVMTARLAPTELCEMARNANPAVRAVAQEALLQLPTSTLVSLLGDPVDADTARYALESQADEYESEEARVIVHALEQVEEDDEDF